MEIIVFVGLPASGKSSYYQKHFSTTHASISKDQMGNVSNKNVRQTQMLHKLLQEGKSIVIDNMNLSIADRLPIVQIAQQYGASLTAYHFVSTTRESVARNSQRTGKSRVQNVAIFTAAKRLQPPSVEEGFDRVVRVRLTRAGFETEVDAI